MNSNFKILNDTYKTINYINKILINYPNKEVILKNNIEQTCYQMIEQLFSYNINTIDRIKEKNIKDFIIKLSMLDFYIRVSYDKKILTARQFVVLGKFLTDIRKMSYALLKK